MNKTADVNCISSTHIEVEIDLLRLAGDAGKRVGLAAPCIISTQV
jgi:hypothetical protein